MDGASQVSSGVPELDQLLGGLYIGDNVVWHDDAGSLAMVFCLNFLQASQDLGRPLIYVSFDRSPKNLLDKLGPLARGPHLTILDCFTWGKGAGSETFTRFYDQGGQPPCRILPVPEPAMIDNLAEALYRTHGETGGEVRFIFESLTGMQELWGGEDKIATFYSHSCPRLYELNTVAYWILEKEAHSPRLRAQINQIAQVVIELSIKRGTTSLTILKAEQRSLENLHDPHAYWSRDLTVSFGREQKSGGPLDLGPKLRVLRLKKRLSQSELAKRVGVTPSTISQVEGGQIYPSLPALLKMAEVLGVDIAYLFQAAAPPKGWLLRPAAEAALLQLPGMPSQGVEVRLLTPVDFPGKAEPYLVEIAPGAVLPRHLFEHRQEEMGYLLCGRLQATVGEQAHTLRPGDLVYFTTSAPREWKNPGHEPARLLWIKIRD
ncbi:MAG: cupin domain-containing protein [Desulfarculus sp.]|nr:MAG: cupin domain-containing protein [Desulfarculus sp.]